MNEIRSSRAELKFPAFRMRNGLRFTNSHTRGWLCTIARSASGTVILDLLPLLLFHQCDGFFAEEVNFVRTHLEDLGRADFRTLAAAITPVRVNGDIPVAGPIRKTIIDYQCDPRLIVRGQRWEAESLLPSASNLGPHSD